MLFTTCSSILLTPALPTAEGAQRKPGFRWQTRTQGYIRCEIINKTSPPTSSHEELSTMEATLSSVPLLDQVQGALNSSPYIPDRQLHVEATDGLVRIEGTVGSFFQKQMAQEVVRRLDGVRRIENQLQVNWT